jgi:hypothetical protein
MDDCTSYSTAHGESNKGNGGVWDKSLQRRESRHRTVFAGFPVHRSTALAVSRIVEDERGDTVLGEKLLRCPPIVDDLSDAVTDEERDFGWIDGSDECGIQRVRSLVNLMAGHLHSHNLLGAAKAPKELVAQIEDASDDRNRDREDDTLHGSTHPARCLVRKRREMDCFRT